MMQRLPAQAPASVVWAKKPIADALLRLRREALTDELVAAVAAAFFAPIQAVAAKVWKVMAENPDQLRAALMSDFAREEAILGQFLDDVDSNDTLAWITGFLRSFYGTAFTLIPIDQVTALVAQQQWQEAAREPTTACFIGGVATLMAAAEEARSGTDVERARELVDLSFLRCREFRDTLRAAGLHLSPYPFETAEHRRDALRAPAARIRQSFSGGSALREWARCDDTGRYESNLSLPSPRSEDQVSSGTPFRGWIDRERRRGNLVRHPVRTSTRHRRC